jgi:hypothetical protein
MVTSVNKGGTQKLPKEFTIVQTYWHDHSLERSPGALFDGTVSFSIQPFSGCPQRVKGICIQKELSEQMFSWHARFNY